MKKKKHIFDEPLNYACISTLLKAHKTCLSLLSYYPFISIIPIAKATDFYARCFSQQVKLAIQVASLAGMLEAGTEEGATEGAVGAAVVVGVSN